MFSLILITPTPHLFFYEIEIFSQNTFKILLIIHRYIHNFITIILLCKIVIAIKALVLCINYIIKIIHVSVKGA